MNRSSPVIDLQNEPVLEIMLCSLHFQIANDKTFLCLLLSLGLICMLIFFYHQQIDLTNIFNVFLCQY